MTLTLTGEITSGPIGPGYLVVVHTDIVGPIPSDDQAVVNVQRPVPPANTLVSGSAQAFGSRTRPVTIGLGLYGGGALTYPVAAGDSVVLYVQWLHANGTLVEDATFTGFTWSPTVGLFVLLEQVVNVTIGTKLDQILNAVRHTYSNAP